MGYLYQQVCSIFKFESFNGVSEKGFSFYCKRNEKKDVFVNLTTGVSAVSLLSWIESDEEAKALEEGKYSVFIYGTPGRVIVEDKVYSRMVCALAIDAWSSCQYVL
jgi:hypothetical protein